MAVRDKPLPSAYVMGVDGRVTMRLLGVLAVHLCTAHASVTDVLTDVLTALSTTQCLADLPSSCGNNETYTKQIKSCSGFLKKSDCWCTDTCYATTSNDCCEVNWVNLGLSIGGGLILTGSLLCCICCCVRGMCPCCPNTRMNRPDKSYAAQPHSGAQGVGSFTPLTTMHNNMNRS